LFMLGFESALEKHRSNIYEAFDEYGCHLANIHCNFLGVRILQTCWKTEKLSCGFQVVLKSYQKKMSWFLWEWWYQLKLKTASSKTLILGSNPSFSNCRNFSLRNCSNRISNPDTVANQLHWQLSHTCICLGTHWTKIR